MADRRVEQVPPEVRRRYRELADEEHARGVLYPQGNLERVRNRVDLEAVGRLEEWAREFYDRALGEGRH